MRLTRRTLMQSLAAMLALPAPLRAAPAVASVEVADLCIAGGGHHGLRAVLADLRVGQRLTLRPQPDNPYDPNAVEVLGADDLRLGYVPRALARHIAPALAEGRVVEVEITRFRGDGTRPEGPLPGPLWRTDCCAGDPVLRLRADARIDLTEA